jgi:hypothetical protein
MKFQTENPEVIELFQHYENIKLLISELENLREHLFENRMIISSSNYMVLIDDKFNYNNAKKLNKIILKDYIRHDQLQCLINLYKLTMNYVYSYHKGLYVYNYCIDWSEWYIKNDCENIIGQLKLYKVYEMKNKLKALIKYKHYNIVVD